MTPGAEGWALRAPLGDPGPQRPSPVIRGFRDGGGYEPEGAAEPGVEPGDGVPVPAGGVPVWLPEPLPMLGQLWVEVEPEPVEPELEPDDVLEEPELVLLDPEFPVLELVDGVEVDEFVAELVPVLPVVLDVVAALATNAPPARRPDVSAPMASTLRRRICMMDFPFISSVTPTRSGRHCTRCSTDLSATAQWRRRVRTVP
jgi:hypothetical protein